MITDFEDIAFMLDRLSKMLLSDAAKQELSMLEARKKDLVGNVERQLNKIFDYSIGTRNSTQMRKGATDLKVLFQSDVATLRRDVLDLYTQYF